MAEGKTQAKLQLEKFPVVYPGLYQHLEVRLADESCQHSRCSGSNALLDPASMGIEACWETVGNNCSV